MITIKMNEDKSLNCTSNANIYQLESNSANILCLIPAIFEGKNLSLASVFLNFILSNGNGNFIELELIPGDYKGYLQFSGYINSKFTYFSGDVVVFLTFVDVESDLSIKTDTAIVKVKEAPTVNNKLNREQLGVAEQVQAYVNQIRNTARKMENDHILYLNEIRSEREKMKGGGFIA